MLIMLAGRPGGILSGYLRAWYIKICHARSEYHTQLAKMSFGKIFDLTAGVYFFFK